MKMPFSVLCVPILSTIKKWNYNYLPLFCSNVKLCCKQIDFSPVQLSSVSSMWAFFLPLLLCKATARLLGSARITPIKNDTAWAAHLNRNHGQNTVDGSEASSTQTLPWKQQCKRNGSQWESLQLKLNFICWALFPCWVLLSFSVTRPVVRKICLVGKTTLSLALHMELLNNTEDINKDRVQVLSKEATPCFSSKEPWV